MKVPILIASDGASWETKLLTTFGEPTSAVTVVRRCVDVLDLHAVARTGAARVAVVSANLPRFDRASVDRLTSAGVVSVAVVERGDDVTEARMRGIGVDVVVPSDADTEVVAAVIAEAARGGAPNLPRTPSAEAVPEHVDHQGGVGAASRNGVVIAIWGPTGAPGRTTVALALADEISRLEREVLLIDADVYGGTVAAHAGMLDNAAGLVEVCRQLRTGRLEPAALAAKCLALRPGLRVLTGSPIAACWPELRPGAIAELLRCARQLVDVCVVDLGFSLETDEGQFDDSVGPRRNGATLAVLAAADLVVVVAAADPIGLQRVVRSLPDLADTVSPADQVLVLNRVRPAVTGRNGRAELDSAVRRFTGLEPFALLPYDRQWLDAAISSGRTLAEVRRSSPLRREIAGLARAVLDRLSERGRAGTDLRSGWSGL